MGIQASDIWKLKNYIAQAISSAIGQNVSYSTMEINSLAEIEVNKFVVHGRYIYFNFGEKSHAFGQYKSTVSLNGEIHSLILNGKVVM